MPDKEVCSGRAGQCGVATINGVAYTLNQINPSDGTDICNNGCDKLAYIQTDAVCTFFGRAGALVVWDGS